MVNTFTYLNRVFRELKAATNENPFFLLLLLVLLSIPMQYAINGFAVALFVFVALLKFKKSAFHFTKSLAYPVLIYLLMALSICWSQDFAGSFRALSKELPLMLLPLCFMIIPPFSEDLRQKTIQYFSGGVVVYIFFYLAKACFRFASSKDFNVFFYHELVTEDLNAIHFSITVAVAFFYFYTKKTKTIFDNLKMVFIAIFIFLLSSKNIFVLFILLLFFYELFYFRATPKIKWMVIGLFTLLSFMLLFSNQISNRFLVEFQSNQHEGTISKDYGHGVKVYNVSVKQAWEKQKFQQNDYFPGTAFRVYQIRIFLEMLQQDELFWTGYGLNASDFRIEQKGIEHNVYLGDATHKGYQKMNFHNQYVQIFAEIGIFGLLLLLIMLFLNLKKAFSTKDFVHICFAILMISLFLTESFLSRQRGIVFFVSLYCLFNTQTISERTFKNSQK